MIIKRMSAVLVVLTLAIIACQTPGIAPSLAPTVQSVPVPNNQPAPLEATSPVEQQGILADLYEKVIPSIVAVQTSTGLGSGFVFDGQGHVVTNFHVVEGTNQVEVDFMSGYKAYGKVIGTDLDSDLAVVEVQNAPAEELHPVALGNSEELKVGQTVVAIGNPFGLNGTMTVGIVSALGRTSESAHSTAEGSFFTAGDLVQTDAAINPGNSGGPLLNLNGEVIGVNREIRSVSTAGNGQAVNSGIGLAISSNIVKRVVPVLISKGKYDYPYLGISSFSDLSLDVINELKLKSFIGAYVTEVVPGGPAM